MKQLSVVVLLMLSAVQINAQNTDDSWNAEKEKQYLANRQDSTTWDYEMLNEDLEELNHGKDFIESMPLKFGAYPVPNYDLLGKGTFRGVGFGSNYQKFGDDGKNLIYSFFMAGKNKLTEKYIPEDKANEVFFTIIVLSDFDIDTINYSHCQNNIISRNNPDYIGQGFIKTQNDEIDYVAFLTADRNEYAIVNMRLFDLKNGRVVLIAPQKDGSLRSMQINPGKVISTEELGNYINELLKQKTVIDFFSDKGNI